MRNLSYGISVLFHPLFIILYFIFIVYWINPPTLMFHDIKSTRLITVSIIASTVFLPLVAILMMKGLNLISSFEMKDKKERVGPLIITGIFYLWLYLNLSKHAYVPDYIVYFILGTIMILFSSFFFNLFFKLSLHSAAISGLIVGLYFVINQYQYKEFSLKLFNNVFLVNTNVILILLVVVAGIIGSSRLYLKDHNQKEIYWGYGIGAISMFVASLWIW